MRPMKLFVRHGSKKWLGDKSIGMTFGRVIFSRRQDDEKITKKDIYSS